MDDKEPRVHPKDVVVKILDWLRDALRGTGQGRDNWRGVLVVLLVGLAGLAAHLWFHHLVIWTHATLLVVAVLLAAIHYTEPRRDPAGKPARSLRAKADDGAIARLVRNPNVGNAPFIFAKAIELYQSLLNSRADTPAVRQKRADAALEVFLEQARDLKTVGRLSDNVAGYIFEQTNGTCRSVWAVCGRKDEPTAKKLYGACRNAFQKGCHIERVFFPPDTPLDEDDILGAIDLHLKAEMTVRAFQTRDLALAALYEFHLPRGFGMTWIGTCNCEQADRCATRRPNQGHDPAASVFVHWGGVGGADHHGVFLQGNADWAEHLFRLCRGIHGKAALANADSENEATSRIIPMNLDEFLTKFPHYRLSSRNSK